MGTVIEGRELQIELPLDWLRGFCERWNITELGLFGSAARGELSPKSDLDFLVSYRLDARVRLMDVVDAQLELEDKFGRHVDLVIREGLKNPYRRRAILRDLLPLYAA